MKLTVATQIGPAAVYLSQLGISAISFGDHSITQSEKGSPSHPEIKNPDLLEAINSLQNLHWMNNLPLVLNGTSFQITIWTELLQIPVGQVRTYLDIAHRIGRPTAARAVANACGANSIAFFIPCHRVIRSNGELGGYRWGIERKRRLLEIERHEGSQNTN